MNSPSARKRGRIGTVERDYIATKTAEGVVPAEIAKLTGRTVEAVLEVMKRLPLRESCVATEATKAELRQSKAWKAVTAEFEADELEYFEERYIALMDQFAEDVLATEENQVFKAIKYELLMSRNLRQQKRLNREIEKAERAHEEAVKKGKEDSILLWESRLSNATDSRQAASKEYASLEQQQQKLMEALKGTREQRIKGQVENNKVSFLERIRSLMVDETREREGRQAEMMKRAAEKEYRRLGAPHKYMDGTVDRPVLSASTVSNDD